MVQADRFYYLPLTANCLPGCDLCQDLGCHQAVDRDLPMLRRALQRAVTAESTGVLFPSGLLKFKLRGELLSLCHELNLRPIVQIKSSLILENQEAILEILAQGCGLNLLLTESPKTADLEFVQTHADFYYFTWIFKKNQTVLRDLGALSKDVIDRLYFYFPFPGDRSDGNFRFKEIARILHRVRASHPNLPIRPPRGIEVWNPAIDPNLELEPVYEPARLSESPNPNPRISVVIPCYNNRDYLMNTLSHLKRQNLSADEFEVIVVDDGSTDGTPREMMSMLDQDQGHWNCKYVFFPRHQPRQMGDGRYRAGVARNLGVKHARGDLLCFLDSDILTPPNFLADLIEKHQRWDVIQCTRLNLKAEISTRNIHFDEIHPERDTFLPEGRYWMEFYAASNWESLPFHWKYVCTYGLSLRKDVFKSIGWIKRGFVYYGFEDTELGYRLAKAGLRFYLNPVVTYHLYHQNDRSEFKNQALYRHRLLSKTARIFFLHVLDTEIYHHFQSFISDSWFTPSVPVWMKSFPRIFDIGTKKKKASAWIVNVPEIAGATKYLLRVLPFCEPNCPLCDCMGCIGSEVATISDLREQLQIVQSQGYTHIVLPPHFFQYPHRAELIREAQNCGLTLVQRISIPFLRTSPVNFESLTAEGVGVEIVIDRELAPSEQSNFLKLIKSCARISSDPNFVSFVFIGHRNSDYSLAIASIPPQLYGNLTFYFPAKEEFDDRFMTCDEIYHFLGGLHDQYGNEKMQKDQRLIVRPYRMGASLSVSEISELMESSDMKTVKSTAQTIYRNTLSPNFYVENLCWMGDHVKARRFFKMVSQTRITRAFLYPVYALFAFFELCLLPTWHARTAQMAGWLVNSKNKGISAYYYFVYQSWISFPIRKAYYFTRYQYHTRIIGRPWEAETDTRKS